MSRDDCFISIFYHREGNHLNASTPARLHEKGNETGNGSVGGRIHCQNGRNTDKIEMEQEQRHKNKLVITDYQAIYETYLPRQKHQLGQKEMLLRELNRKGTV